VVQQYRPTFMEYIFSCERGQKSAQFFKMERDRPQNQDQTPQTRNQNNIKRDDASTLLPVDTQRRQTLKRR